MAANQIIVSAFLHEVTNVQITPEFRKASENLRELSPERRNCLFPDEEDLVLLQKYSQVEMIIQEHDLKALLNHLQFRMDACLNVV